MPDCINPQSLLMWHHLVREKVNDKSIKVNCPTDQMLAGIMMKGLPRQFRVMSKVKKIFV